MTEECNSKGLILTGKIITKNVRHFELLCIHVCIALLDAMFPFLFNSNL